MSTTGKFRARDGWLALAATFGFILLSLSVFTRQLNHRDKLSYQLGEPKVPAPKVRLPTEGTSRPSRSHLPQLHIPWWLLALVGQAVLVVLVLLAVLLLTRFVPKFQRSRPAPHQIPGSDPAPELPEQLTERVVDTFDAAIRSLSRGRTRDAIIACWLRLEQLAETAGAPKLASETSTELTARWSKMLSLSVAPLDELAELYREARFSSHAMSAAESERAKQTFELLRREVAGQLAGHADG